MVLYGVKLGLRPVFGDFLAFIEKLAIFVVDLLRYHRIDIASLCLIVLEVELEVWSI